MTVQMTQNESARLVRRISKLSVPVVASRREDALVNTTRVMAHHDEEGGGSGAESEDEPWDRAAAYRQGPASGSAARPPPAPPAGAIRFARMESKSARSSVGTDLAARQQQQPRPLLRYSVTLKARLQEEVQRSVASRTHSRTQGGEFLYDLQARQRLVGRLQRLKLLMVEVRGDGNCQFRSISKHMFGTEERYQELRTAAVAYMKKHRDDFECFLGEAFLDYMSDMATDCTWGDELTLRSLANHLGVTLHVVTSDESNFYLQYIPDSGQSKANVFLAYIAPVHYNCVISDPDAIAEVSESPAPSPATTPSKATPPGGSKAATPAGKGTTSPSPSRPVLHAHHPAHGGAATPASISMRGGAAEYDGRAETLGGGSGPGDESGPENVSPIPASRRKKLQRLTSSFKKCLRGQPGSDDDGEELPHAGGRR